MTHYVGRMATADRIAKRIEAIREDRGISVSDLSEVTGIADKTLRRRRLFPTLLNFGEFDALCAALDVKAEDVLNLDVDISSLMRRQAA